MAPFVFLHVIASEAKQSQPQAHERLAEIASSRFARLAMTVNSRSYFPACALSAARSASLRKLITATLLVRE